MVAAPPGRTQVEALLRVILLVARTAQVVTRKVIRPVDRIHPVAAEALRPAQATQAAAVKVIHRAVLWEVPEITTGALHQARAAVHLQVEANRVRPAARAEVQAEP